MQLLFTMDSIKTYDQLFNILQGTKCFDANILLRKILEIVDKTVSDNAQNELRNVCNIFCTNLKTKWRQSYYKENYFRQKNNGYVENLYILRYF